LQFTRSEERHETVTEHNALSWRVVGCTGTFPGSTYSGHCSSHSS